MIWSSTFSHNKHVQEKLTADIYFTYLFDTMCYCPY